MGQIRQLVLHLLTDRLQHGTLPVEGIETGQPRIHQLTLSLYLIGPQLAATGQPAGGQATFHRQLVGHLIQGGDGLDSLLEDGQLLGLLADLNDQEQPYRDRIQGGAEDQNGKQSGQTHLAQPRRKHGHLLVAAEIRQQLLE